MNQNASNKNPLSSDFDTTISLLNVYLTEWVHRDQILWSQVFKFYYAILIVILLPNIANYLEITLPYLPVILFRLVGLFLSCIFLYISLGYAIRLQAIGETCQKIINILPEDYQRNSFKDKRFKKIPVGKMLYPKLSYLVCFSLFISLILLSIILMVI